MAGFYGADVEQLRLLGSELDKHATDIEGLVGRLNTRINTTDWRGPDANRFFSDWRDRDSLSLKRVSNSLKEAASLVSLNAREQESASGSNGSIPSISTAHDHFESAMPMPVDGPVIPPGFIWSTTRDAINQKIPGTLWSWGQIGGLVPGADEVLAVRDIADTIQQGQWPIHQAIDTAGGVLRGAGAETLNPALYLSGTAVGMWNSVWEEAEKMDIPNTWQSNMDYIAKDPWGAVSGAANGIVSFLPNLVKNFTW